MKIRQKRQRVRCANCGGRLFTEYRSGGYDFVRKITCVKCKQYGEDIWPGCGGCTKAELGM